jgi:hypothetical protein
MTKKLIIKLFKLHDISSMLVQAKEKQRQLDKKYYDQELEEELFRLKTKHSLDLQEKDATITLLEEKIKTYKQREKELDNKEYSIKKDAKENAFMATKISIKVEEFALKIMDIVGDMKGIEAEADSHKKRIGIN